MNTYIEPYVISINEVNRYNPDKKLNDFGQSPESRWAVDLEVKIGNKLIQSEYAKSNIVSKAFKKFTASGQDYQMGMIDLPLYVVVCSQAYLRNPIVNEHDDKDLKFAFVREKYNELEIKQEVSDIINSIGIKPIEEVVSIIGQFIDVTPWRD